MRAPPFAQSFPKHAPAGQASAPSLPRPAKQKPSRSCVAQVRCTKTDLAAAGSFCRSVTGVYVKSLEVPEAAAWGEKRAFFLPGSCMFVTLHLTLIAELLARLTSQTAKDEADAGSSGECPVTEGH